MATLLIDPKVEHGDLVRKAYTAGLEIKDGERAVIMRISTIAVDRDKEVLLPKGIDLKAFRQNPVVLWAHQYDQPPIAQVTDIKTDEKGIIAKAVFADTDFANDIYRLYQGKFLRAASIGFLPKQARQPNEKDLTEHPEWAEVRAIYEKVELLEFSCVPIPSNREALVMAVGKGAISLTKETRAILQLENKNDDPEIIPACATADREAALLVEAVAEAERIKQLEKMEREKLDGTIRKQQEIIQQCERALAQVKTDLLAEKVKRSEQEIQHEAADAGIEKLIDGVCALIRRKTGSVS